MQNVRDTRIKRGFALQVCAETVGDIALSFRETDDWSREFKLSQKLLIICIGILVSQNWEFHGAFKNEITSVMF